MKLEKFYPWEYLDYWFHLHGDPIYQPSAQAGYDTKTIFKQSLAGLNSEFFLLLD